MLARAGGLLRRGEARRPRRLVGRRFGAATRPRPRRSDLVDLHELCCAVPSAVARRASQLAAVAARTLRRPRSRCLARWPPASTRGPRLPDRYGRTAQRGGPRRLEPPRTRPVPGSTLSGSTPNGLRRPCDRSGCGRARSVARNEEDRYVRRAHHVTSEAPVHSARHGPMTGGDGEGRRRSACEVAERIRQVIGMDDRDRGWKVAAPQGEETPAQGELRLSLARPPSPSTSTTDTAASKVSAHVQTACARRRGAVLAVTATTSRSTRTAPATTFGPTTRAGRPVVEGGWPDAGIEHLGQRPGCCSTDDRERARALTRARVGAPPTSSSRGSRPCSARAGAPPPISAWSSSGSSLGSVTVMKLDRQAGLGCNAGCDAQARSAWGP